MQQLSAEEVLRRADEASCLVQSFRVQETMDESDGQSHVSERIYVGREQYARIVPSVTGLPQGFELPRLETLFLETGVYGRDAAGRWRPVEEIGGTTYRQYAQTTGDPFPSTDPLSAASQYYMTYHLLQLSPIERLEDEARDGVSYIHLRGRFSGGGAEGEERQRALDEMRQTWEADHPGEPLPAVPTAPARYDGTMDLWIDPSTYLVRFVERDEQHYRAGNPVSTYHSQSELSQFNEAELPGPLPD